MELDAVAVGRDVQVVDPEVRAHVYSLVTAVSLQKVGNLNSLLTVA